MLFVSILDPCQIVLDGNDTEYLGKTGYFYKTKTNHIHHWPLI